jgi:hypothetical protein
MANRLSKEKAHAIAAEYTTNGFKKVVALLSVGYSVSYANKVGLKLYDNDLVKQAIEQIQASTKAKTATTVADIERMYEEDRKLAEQCNQAGAAVSATTGIARLYGFDKDNSLNKEQTIIVIAPKSPKRVDSEVIDE